MSAPTLAHDAGSVKHRPPVLPPAFRVRPEPLPWGLIGAGMNNENDEATRAWNGVLFDKFARFKHLLTAGLTRHGDALLRRSPPQPGWRVVDLGCGFGDMTRQLAAALGDTGEAVGVDVAENFVNAAARDAERAAERRATFFRADVQVDDLRG